MDVRPLQIIMLLTNFKEIVEFIVFFEFLLSTLLNCKAIIYRLAIKDYSPAIKDYSLAIKVKALQLRL